MPIFVGQGEKGARSRVQGGSTSVSCRCDSLACISEPLSLLDKIRAPVILNGN